MDDDRPTAAIRIRLPARRQAAPHPAVFFGTLDSTGTVAVGKRADLVMLAENPLKNIRVTTHIVGVMLGGRWLDRAMLDVGLKTLEGRMNARD